MGFYDRFSTLLQKKKVTWTKVANDLQLGINSKRYWETKGTTPDGETLVKLAEYFGVSTDYLLGIEDTTTRLMDEALAVLDEPKLTSQEAALIKMFRQADEMTKLKIIQNVMNLCE